MEDPEAEENASRARSLVERINQDPVTCAQDVADALNELSG